MDVQAALKGQYHAAMAMLRQAIQQCPDELWNGGAHAVPFWQVAYHTIYATHLYLHPNEEAFRPWEHHRAGYDDLPWPPDSGSTIDDPYTKPQILQYWRLCDALIDSAVDRLDLDAPTSGFSWHKTIPKLEHQIHNIRHIQHHAAMLSGRLRLALGPGADLPWMRTDGQTYKP